ncbi:hypothetical protein RIVERRIDER_87 [Xanthomonas phage RiverRider]|uniref:Tail fiber protein n=1 Tax=Xanthomonas phage RiverRider TaxID=2108116 RepID=A0A2P1JUZ3_9CAUD|nr:hypothetical protein HWB58_gp48 [Xanthomonas phage RiverRider]AVO23168.1 hypothetical protein RIVERRIDER_87 [Xanthomonas phage RiverRider]
MSQLPDHSSRIICSELGFPYPFQVSVAPAKMVFGNVILTRSSVPRTIVVTNVGTNPVRIGEIVASGSFTATSDAPAYLNPGQHFLIDLVFRPRNEGISVGGLYVNTNGAQGTEYTSLMGYGYVEGTDPGGGEGGNPGGGSVLPRYWAFLGDGETTGFPIDGADAYDKLLYDTYIENTPGQKDYVGVNPVDFTIDPPIDGASPMIRFLVPVEDNAAGYTILRGYAKVYETPKPIETVAPGIDTTVTENNTIIDRTKQNTILVINSFGPITVRIRNKTGDDTKDWKNGEFFSVLQRGPGAVTLAMENPGQGQLYPAEGFIATTRGQDCVMSATCFNADGNQWVISGDMYREVASADVMQIELIDRSVASTAGITVGTKKDSYTLPYSMKLDAVVNAGLTGSLSDPQTDGTILTMDILRNGVSILTNKLTIDNNETTSTTATTPVSYAAGGDVLNKGDVISLSVTQVGNGTGRALRAYLLGQRLVE